LSLKERVKCPRICPVVADNLVGLSHVVKGSALPSVVLFLGSSIGNYDQAESIVFLRHVQEALKVGDFLLVGFDLKKDLDVMHRAYDDREGVTRGFNMNLLARMNRELGANFDLTEGVWLHHALWNPSVSAMESWIVPTETTDVTLGPVAQNAQFHFEAYEGIHVERSFKYTLPQIRQIGEAAGFTIAKEFVHSFGYCNTLFQKK
jgi:uncharacterized SAM-dependent methyltransferase